MTDSVFDIALEKRFTDSAEVSTIEVTSADVLLIRDNETGAIMRLPFATLAAAISSAFSSSFASLVDGKVPASQLPSYVDDVLEYANLAAFPGTGESGKIYVTLDTNKTYRWSGSAYVEISSSLALGETSSTAYRGDRGKTAYDHSQTTGNPHGTTKTDVGLANVDNTSDSAKEVLNATVLKTARTINGALFDGSANIRTLQNYTTRGQSSISGGNTANLFSVSADTTNRSYLLVVQQSGTSINSAVGFAWVYNGLINVVTISNTNTNPVLLLSFGVSGSNVTLTVGSGYGLTTWDWQTLRIG